jgi:hypothetical protein
VPAVYAVRHVHGAYVIVTQFRGVSASGGFSMLSLPALTGDIFTADQLAAVATTPALLGS